MMKAACSLVSLTTLALASLTTLALASLTTLALASLTTVALASALPSPRQKCPPKPPSVTEFNVTEYLGDWYEQRRFPAFFQLNTRCVRASYGSCPDPAQPEACPDQPDRVSVL